MLAKNRSLTFIILLALVPLLTACPFEDEPPKPTGSAILQFTTQNPSSTPIASQPVTIYFAESFPYDYLVGSTDSLGNVTYDSVLTIKAPLLETQTDSKGKALVKDYNNNNYVYYFDNGSKQKYGGFQITADQTRTFIIDLDR